MVTAAETGSTLRVRVTATSPGGSGAADSQPTAVVQQFAGQVTPAYSFVRHVIDAGSQVTTTLAVGDIDGDGADDVVVGGKSFIGWFRSGTGRTGRSRPDSTAWAPRPSSRTSTVTGGWTS